MELIKTKSGLPFIISKIENHKSIKPLLLNSIKQFPIDGIYTKDESIYNTDYQGTNAIPKYFPIISSSMTSHITNLKTFLNYSETTNCGIASMWFQQYKKGDFHNWHIHNNSMLSSIYYLDLGTKSPKTTFKFNNKEFDIEVSEGSILTFPSFLEHCSKPNQSNKIKTIIAFNIS